MDRPTLYVQRELRRGLSTVAVFEVEFVKQLFDDYKPIELEIWHTYTDTTLEKILGIE